MKLGLFIYRLSNQIKGLLLVDSSEWEEDEHLLNDVSINPIKHKLTIDNTVSTTWLEKQKANKTSILAWPDQKHG